MNRDREGRAVASVGPAGNDAATLEATIRGGADALRLNTSHGNHDDHDDHKRRRGILRGLEQRLGRPSGVLPGRQGPQLRIGTFANGSVKLDSGHLRGP